MNQCQNCGHWHTLGESPDNIPDRETASRGECRYLRDLKDTDEVPRVRYGLQMSNDVEHEEIAPAIIELLSKFDVLPLLVTTFDWSCQGWSEVREKAETK